jgi:nucleotide-binding universal stress UspA family protein
MYKTILLPIDHAQESSWKKALPVAVSLSETYGAALHLVSVIPDFSHGMVRQYFPEDYEEKLTEGAHANMQAFIAEHLSGQEVTSHIVHGPIYQRIIETAENTGADLIVMGSHRPELADYLIGPNAARVVRHTACSVMVVRE